LFDFAPKAQKNKETLLAMKALVRGKLSRRSGARWLVAPLCAALSLPAFAQEGAAGIPFGPMVVYPGVDFAIGHDDNLFSSDRNKRGSDFSILSPYVKLEGKPTPHSFDVTFRADFGRYRTSRADDYDDYSLTGNVDLVFTGRAGLKLRGEHRYGHDPRGSTDRPGGATPDEYRNSGIEGIFHYGAPGAQGRIEVDAGYFEREYENNRTFTVASDRTTGQLGGTFFWRIAPKTELLFQAQRRDIDYDLSTSTQDSTEDRYYFGAKWEATALTQGTVKIGRLKKDFDSPLRQDFSGSSWDAGIRWSPRTYSVFDFSTSKQTGESTGVGDTILTKTYGVTWTHAWSSRVRTQALGNWSNARFLGAGATREDDTGTLGLKVSYQFRRWLRFGAEYTYTDRDSNDGVSNFRRNLILFTVGATL
jgi:hypothetical protein